MWRACVALSVAWKCQEVEITKVAGDRSAVLFSYYL